MTAKRTSKRTHQRLKALVLLILFTGPLQAHSTFADEPVQVTAANFVRAETDYYNARSVAQFGLGQFWHARTPTPLAEQNVIRMNRDTIYSMAVFDLTNPLEINVPDPGERYLSMQVIDQDHFTVGVEYEPGTYEYSIDTVGTRYLTVIIRIFMDPHDDADISAANNLQDNIQVAQADPGQFDVPDWDEESLSSVRGLLLSLSATVSDSFDQAFGSKNEVDPIMHLLGTAAGWAGLPSSSAVYPSVFPNQNNGEVPHAVTVNEVPVDGFWSITVYNDAGFMEQNTLGVNSFNSVTAKPNTDGSTTVHFGSCEDGRSNCLPIMEGWNYTVRLYKPRESVLSGEWAFPEAQPVK